MQVDPLYKKLFKNGQQPAPSIHGNTLSCFLGNISLTPTAAAGIGKKISSLAIMNAGTIRSSALKIYLEVAETDPNFHAGGKLLHDMLTVNNIEHKYHVVKEEDDASFERRFIALHEWLGQIF